VEPEERTPAQCRADRGRSLALAGLGGSGRADQRGVLSEVHGHAVEPCAHPDHLAGRAELVEQLRAVIRNAPREDVRLPQRDRQRQRLQRDERLPQARAAVDSVPRRKEAGVGRLLDRLDLLSERRERRTPQPPEDVWIAPLSLRATRPELAADEPLLLFERLELVLRYLALDPETRSGLGGRERSAAARESRQQRPERELRALEERVGQARRRHRA